MLNEILELEAYVTDPTSLKPRIQPKMLTNNYKEAALNWIEGILVIIARGFVFGFETEKEIYSGEGFVNENILNDTKYILFRWCGFDLGVLEDRKNVIDDLEKHRQGVWEWLKKYPEADGWLKAYWMCHCPKGKENQWEEVEGKWGNKLCGMQYARKQITIESVIAIALGRGPLRKRYMIVRKDSSPNPVKDKKNRFTYLYTFVKPLDNGKGKSVQEQTREKLLKNVAVYLISKEYHPENQKFIRLNKGQLMGWYGYDDYNYAFEAWYRPRFFWREKQIMEAHGNDREWDFIKFSINQEFIDYFEFQLITEEQINDIDRSRYWILEDTGHGIGSLKCLE